MDMVANRPGLDVDEINVLGGVARYVVDNMLVRDCLLSEGTAHLAVYYILGT